MSRKLKGRSTRGLATTKDVCEFAQVSASTVAKWRRQGMPFLDLCEDIMGHTYRYHLHLVDSWLIGEYRRDRNGMYGKYGGAFRQTGDSHD